MHPGVPADSSLVVEAFLRSMEDARELFQRYQKEMPKEVLVHALQLKMGSCSSSGGSSSSSSSSSNIVAAAVVVVVTVVVVVVVVVIVVVVVVRVVIVHNDE